MIFSRILAFPLMMLAGFVAFKILVDKQEEYHTWILPLIASFLALYILSHAINMWWWRKNPPRLSKQVFSFLRRSLPIIDGLTKEKKEIFHKRLSLYIKEVEFIGQGIADVPDDVKAAILAPGVLYSVNSEKIPYDYYHRVAIYQHPFLSPAYNSAVHSSEINHTDGMLILSLEQLMPSLIHEKSGLNLTLYEYGKTIPVEDRSPVLSMKEIDSLGPSFEKISQYIGMHIDVNALSAHHSIKYYDKLADEHPNKLWVNQLIGTT